MAEQKLEQLRGLTWGFDSQGQGLPLIGHDDEPRRVSRRRRPARD